MHSVKAMQMGGWSVLQNALHEPSACQQGRLQGGPRAGGSLPGSIGAYPGQRAGLPVASLKPADRFAQVSGRLAALAPASCVAGGLIGLQQR